MVHVSGISKNPDILLRFQELRGIGGKPRGDDHLEEGLDQFLRRLFIHGAVQGDNAAEGRNGVSGHRLSEGLGHVAVGCGRAAGIGVLDDDDAGQGEVGDDLPGGVAVHDVIVGKLLPLELPCIGEGRKPRVFLPVEGGLLMGILPVTEVLRLGELDRRRCRGNPFFGAFAAEQTEVVGNGAVVTGGELEGLFGQFEVGRFRNLAPRLRSSPRGSSGNPPDR